MTRTCPDHTFAAVAYCAHHTATSIALIDANRQRREHNAHRTQRDRFVLLAYKEDLTWRPCDLCGEPAGMLLGQQTPAYNPVLSKTDDALTAINAFNTAAALLTIQEGPAT